MKTTKFLILPIIAAGLAFSCVDDKPHQSVTEPDKVEVKFSSGVAAHTRVADDQWEGFEEIGIYMVDNGITTVTEGAENILYATSSVGASATFTSETPIHYPLDESKVDFIAYHPHTTMAGFVYPVNLATQNPQSDIDFMIAKADNEGEGYDKDHPDNVAFTFEHQLAKVVINVSAGAGVGSLDGITATIKGMSPTAGFDITSPAGGFTNMGTAANITPVSADADTFEATLLPVALGGAQVVEFTVGGETYKWTMSENTGTPKITALEQGAKHTFDVTLQKNAVSATGTIEAWLDGGSANGIAE